MASSLFSRLSSRSRILRAAPLPAIVFFAASAAEAGNCPVPECVPGEILGAGGTIPPNAPGIGYRALVGKFVPQPVDAGADAEDSGEPPPPGQFTPFAQIIDENGDPLLANFDEDPINPAYKVVKPAEGLRPNRTYKIRFDKECATSGSPVPRAEVLVKTGDSSPTPQKVGEIEVGERRVANLEVLNTEDGGQCKVTKEVSAVKIKFKASPELLPYAKMVGVKPSIDGEDNGATLEYGNLKEDGTFEAEVFVPCPTNERTAKIEVTARVLGASLTPPAATADVTVLACGGGASASDGGGDGGTAKAADSGCSCDTSGQGSGMAGLSFAVGAIATGLVIRSMKRRRDQKN